MKNFTLGRFGVIFVFGVLMSILSSCAAEAPDEQIVYKDLGQIARDNATFSASLDAGEPGETCDEDGVFTTCYTGASGTAGVGQCKSGKQYCIGGTLTACEGSVTPVAESCNGKDDDCDASTDEDGSGAAMTMACYDGPSAQKGVGECKEGTSTCSSGAWGACMNSGLPSTEVCDGQDDDCDGVTDENQAGTALTQACYGGPSANENVGECKRGTQTCSAGAYGSCVGWVAPIAEACNTKDDDCDNGVDEDFADLEDVCTAGVGACMASGEKVCKSDGTGTQCSAVAGSASTETCNDMDDDCDNSTDEGADGNALVDNDCYTGPAVTKNVGECKAGSRTCEDGGVWSECAGSVLPTPEVCNAKNDDCDAWTDENSSNSDHLAKACYTGPTVTMDVGACMQGWQHCFNGSYQGACHDEVLPTPEVCTDNMDNDCDATTDTDCDYAAACEDGDGDGFGKLCEKGVDCNDSNAMAFPGSPEWFEEGGTEDPKVDNDCDGSTDDAVSFPTSGGALLVLVESTGHCPLSDIIILDNFKGGLVKSVNTWQGSAFATNWFYEGTGVLPGTFWLNFELDNDGQTGGDPYHVDMEGEMLAGGDCLDVSVYWNGTLISCTSEETSSAVWPFPKANMICILPGPTL